MKILLINSVCGIRSTGRIASDIAEEYMAQGHICRIAYGRETAPEKYQAISYKIGSDLEVKVNALQARLLDNEGFCARSATKKFIKWANDYDPDVLWLHNIHGYYINIELLFGWIKSRPQMQVKWTLHDCWSFTGHCAHFSCVNCYKWREKCHNCTQKKEYPKSMLADNSVSNFIRKQKAFCGVKNMTIITPSKWLADLVSQSFLKEYPIEVKYNKIDLSIFTPTVSDFRERTNLIDKKIVLGVASAWSERKGLYDFIALSKRLNNQYAIVLVGLQESQIRIMPKNILCIPRTNSTEELAEIYSAADVFLNPSREETFGLTTLEALSCGTPAIVYKDTACEEIAKLYGGTAVEQSIDALKNAIEQLI